MSRAFGSSRTSHCRSEEDSDRREWHVVQSRRQDGHCNTFSFCSGRQPKRGVETICHQPGAGWKTIMPMGGEPVQVEWPARFLDCHSSRAVTRPIIQVENLHGRCEGGPPCPVNLEDTSRLAARTNGQQSTNKWESARVRCSKLYYVTHRRGPARRPSTSICYPPCRRLRCA